MNAVLTTVADTARYKNKSSPSLDGLKVVGYSDNILTSRMLFHNSLSRQKPT